MQSDIGYPCCHLTQAEFFLPTYTMNECNVSHDGMANSCLFLPGALFQRFFAVCVVYTDYNRTQLSHAAESGE